MASNFRGHSQFVYFLFFKPEGRQRFDSLSLFLTRLTLHRESSCIAPARAHSCRSSEEACRPNQEETETQLICFSQVVSFYLLQLMDLSSPAGNKQLMLLQKQPVSVQ